MPITAILHKLTEADIGFVPDVEKVYKVRKKGAFGGKRKNCSKF